MHPAMWSKPSLQEHVRVLRERGVRILGPIEGSLASGEVGLGRMVEPEEIADALDALAGGDASAELRGRTVVVSAGPTWEAVDSVRFLANRSSGKMGFALAAEAARRGARSILVAGPVALATPPGVERHDVETALEMEGAVRRLAPAADAVIMSAAVADFRPESYVETKIKRHEGTPEIRLARNPDILASLAEIAPRAVRVGFAAETGVSDTEAARKLAAKRAHLLVANDVSRADIGFGSDLNEVTVHRRDAEPVKVGRRPKVEVAALLLDLLVALLERPAREAELAGR
jgi:phosphopantothenoylcysteine decarboxylase/phosphopantothenate--cysteine ligase